MVLQPMYPLLIQQFVDDYKLMDGVALDIGVGPGWLGMELAKITDMKIVFLDISLVSLHEARSNFEMLEVDNAASFIQADVHDIPLDDNYADFIMSRGSIWFWEKPEKGLQEIYRILKPGGVAIVGGGLGRYLPLSMRSRMQVVLQRGLAKRMESRPDLHTFQSIVEKAHLPAFEIRTDGDTGTGRWVEIRKPQGEKERL